MEDDAKSLWISQIWLICFIILSSASAQSDFISIDCGGQGTIPYNDTATGFQWKPDGALMTMGLSATIRDPNLLRNGIKSKALTTLRYFPDMEIKKFCYELGPVTEGRVYLVRATFLHGNYNGKNDNYIIFDLLLEADYWDSIKISNTSTIIEKEAYMVAQRSNVSICVASSLGSYTPFISSLEIRPIDGDLIATRVMKESNLLMFMACRYNFGALTDDDIRYPADRYDRIWHARTDTPKINTNTPVTSTLSDAPPSIVMQTAIVFSGGASNGFRFTGLELGTYYMGLYFAEIEIAVGLGDRIFNITKNGVKWYGPLDVYSEMGGSFKTLVVFNNKTKIDDSTLHVNFNITGGSQLGPIWNAFELLQYSDTPANATTLIDDVQALNDVKMSLGLSNWTGDPCLPLAHHYPWVNCSLDIPPRVTSLNLPKMNLQGSLPSSINSLNALVEINFEHNLLSGNIPKWPSLLKLQTLNLQSNNLSGTIPDYLGDLPYLAELLLQYNNFSGQIPAKIQEKVSRSQLILYIDGNPNLCVNNCAPAATNPSSWKKTVIIVVVLIGGVITITLVIVLVYCLLRSTAPQSAPSPADGGNHNERDKRPISDDSHKTLKERNGMLFSYQDIKTATENYSQIIGEGGFGKVFYGIWNKAPIAVKVLSEDSTQGRREFSNEVQILSKIHHKNLIPLVGYCESPKLILVYEYMNRGSLQAHLNASSSTRFPWRSRLTIALDSAQALEYLHDSCEPSIIHGDVKSSNILLDDNMRGKFGDFGLSRIHKDEITNVATMNLKGTRGYIDPVYFSTLTLNVKSDVYSFGVVLLEIISGKRPFMQGYPEQEENLADWVRIHYEQGTGIEAMMDTNLKEEGNNMIASIWKVMDIAMRCVKKKREDRPNMGSVVQELKEALLMVEEITGDSINSPSMPFMGVEGLYEVRTR